MEIYSWQGRKYLGLQAVAKAAGVTTSAIGHHLRQHGHLDRLGCGTGNHGGSTKRRGQAKPRPTFGFPSIRAFADAAGLPVSTIYNWRSQGRHDRLHAAAKAAGAKPSSNIPH